MYVCLKTVELQRRALGVFRVLTWCHSCLLISVNTDSHQRRQGGAAIFLPQSKGAPLIWMGKEVCECPGLSDVRGENDA